MSRSPRAARAAFASLLLVAASAIAPSVLAEDGVDPRIEPGDDFFAYANGAWLHATKIPPGMGRWGARNEIAEKTAEQVGRVIRDASASALGSASTAGASPHERGVAGFYAAYLDEAGIERNGLAPIAPLLASIDRLRDKAGLSAWLGRNLRADVDPLGAGTFDSRNLFGLSVAA